MKKIIPIIIMVICAFTSCSKDDDIEQPQIDATMKEIWASLNGSYKATHYFSNSGKEWYSETIEFYPYKEPKEITPTVMMFPSFTAYGTATITDTRVSDIAGSSTCYYSIDVAYNGATPTISFFEYGESGEVINKEDKRNIKNWNNAQFDMWDYGLSETENIITYYRQ